ncbi:hypothetical protein MBANPS3_001641 [Mucor bainieri]
MSTHRIVAKTLHLAAARRFSSAGYRKPYNSSSSSSSSIKTKDTPSPWDHVYGISSVLSALKAKKRQTLDTLYIQETDEAKTTTQKKDGSLMAEILSIAKADNIYAVAVDKGRLNNLTDNKPHQGVVLKASPRTPIEISVLSAIHDGSVYEALPRVNKRGSEQDRDRNRESATSIQFNSSSSRMPFWIALDQVQDPQNLGSIMRSAYFFGVDGVVLCSKNSAPLSPAVSKVSSGAIEMMDVYSTPNLVKLLKESHANGWDIVGAAAGDVSPCIDLSQFRQHTRQKPVILVLGNEGTGLRTNVRNGCNAFVSIPSAMDAAAFRGSVDSLNVGVAAGVLMATALCS